MAIPRLELDDTALLVVDVQERLLPAMHNAVDVERQVGRMIDGANVLGVPILVTEQYRKGLGLTVPALAQRLESAVCVQEKLKFSACVEPVLATLKRRAIRSVVVVGIEAHVCVMQTCLDLAESGYVVAVAVDAIGSRKALDQQAAIERLVQSGILPTTVESALLEMVHEAGTARFKAMLPVIK
jgi:nicotinamidase-related amidase